MQERFLVRLVGANIDLIHAGPSHETIPVGLMGPGGRLIGLPGSSAAGIENRLATRLGRWSEGLHGALRGAPPGRRAAAPASRSRVGARLSRGLDAEAFAWEGWPR